MASLRKIKREIKILKIVIAKFIKKVKHSMGASQIRKTPQDRMILRLVKSLLANQEMHVFFSPISSKVYIHSKDKDVIVVYDFYKISLTNHKFFFNSYLPDGVSEEIIRIAKERIEYETSLIDKEANVNEMNFLNDIYGKFSQKSDTEEETGLSQGFFSDYDSRL